MITTLHPADPCWDSNSITKPKQSPEVPDSCNLDLRKDCKATFKCCCISYKSGIPAYCFGAECCRGFHEHLPLTAVAKIRREHRLVFIVLHLVPFKYHLLERTRLVVDSAITEVLQYVIPNIETPKPLTTTTLKRESSARFACVVQDSGLDSNSFKPGEP